MGKNSKVSKGFLIFGIIAIVATVITCILFYLPFTAFKSEAMQGIEHFDGRFIYSENDVLSTLNLMTQEDVTSYVYYTTCDFLFSAAYFCSMTFITVLLLKKKTKWLGVCIPLFPYLFDTVENVLIMLLLHGNRSGASVLSVFSALKWIGIIIWVIFVVPLIVYNACKKIKERYNKNTDKIENKAKKLCNLKFRKRYNKFSYNHNRFYNLVTYAKEFDKPLSQVPFTDADSLVLCQLAYMNLESFKGESVCDILKIANEKGIDLLKVAPYCYDDCVSLLKSLASNKRFSDIKIVDARSKLSYDISCQFGITLFDCPNFAYIACRGTDDHMVGWLEDIDLIYADELNSQKHSLEALNDFVKLTDKPIVVGGHSKGGNIAVYVSAFCDKEIQQRIVNVYNYDGPGLLEDKTSDARYNAVLSKTKKYCPEFSVFGMVLHSGEYRVIYSHARGIWQHYLFNWQINKNDGSLVCADFTSHASKTIRLVIEKVLPTMPMEERKLFRHLVARALDGANVFVLGDFTFGKVVKMFKIWGKQPAKDQLFLWKLLFKVLRAIPICQRKARKELKAERKEII